MPIVSAFPESPAPDRASLAESKVSNDDMERVRKGCPHFRVLVIGRANAGKTTILQKVCNTAEKPSIRDSQGRKMGLSLLKPSNMRGLHDVEKELVFPNNPGFVFHDSRGFESGGTDELQKVRKFIAKRAKEKNLENKLHVIWYCIPTDDSRLLTTAETSFFDECGTGKVPVVAVFTKFDHGDIAAFCTLQEEGLDWEDAKRQAPVRAMADFKKAHLGRVYEKKYPPKSHVILRDLDKPGSDCGDLVEQTADALDDDTLRVLFVSTQQDNLRVCIKYALKETVIPFLQSFKEDKLTENDMKDLMYQMLLWFPNEGEDLWMMGRRYYFSLAKERESVAESLSSLAGPPPVKDQICRLGLGLTIIAEYSYSLPPENRLQKSLAVYQSSPVSKNISRVVKRLDLNQYVGSLTRELVNIVEVNSLSMD